MNRFGQILVYQAFRPPILYRTQSLVFYHGATRAKSADPAKVDPAQEQISSLIQESQGSRPLTSVIALKIIKTLADKAPEIAAAEFQKVINEKWIDIMRVPTTYFKSIF